MFSTIGVNHSKQNFKCFAACCTSICTLSIVPKAGWVQTDKQLHNSPFINYTVARKCTYCSSLQRSLNPFQLGDRTPALTDQTLLSYVDIEPVHGMINSFDLPDFDRPYSDRLGNGREKSKTMNLGLCNHLKV